MTFGSNEALLGYMKTVSDVVAAHALKAQLAAVQSGRPYSGEKYAQFYADLTRDIDEARRVASPADAIRVALETFQRATEHVYQFNALRSEIDQSVAEVENSIRQLTVASPDIASSEAFEQFVAEASATGLIKREQDRLLELSAEVSRACKETKSLSHLGEVRTQSRGLHDHFESSKQTLQRELRAAFDESRRANLMRQDLLQRLALLVEQGRAFVVSPTADDLRRLSREKFALGTTQKILDVEIADKLESLASLRRDMSGVDTRVGLAAFSARIGQLRSDLFSLIADVEENVRVAKQKEAIEIESALLREAEEQVIAERLRDKKSELLKQIRHSRDYILSRWVMRKVEGVSQSLVDSYCEHPTVKGDLREMKEEFDGKFSALEIQCQATKSMEQLTKLSNEFDVVKAEGNARRDILTTQFSNKLAHAKARNVAKASSFRGNVRLGMFATYIAVAIAALSYEFNFYNLFVWVLGFVFYSVVTSVVITIVTPNEKQPKPITLQDLLLQESGTKVVV